jgi:hypothetical protein
MQKGNIDYFFGIERLQLGPSLCFKTRKISNKIKKHQKMR